MTTRRVVVIGASAGGLDALAIICSGLPAGFSLPIAVTQHVAPHAIEGLLAAYLDSVSEIQVKEALDGEPFLPGLIYFSPPNYHLLCEYGETLALSVDAKVRYARPSIDVLFDSAAAVYGERAIGVVLTGANHDGAAGLAAIADRGGTTIVQDPHTAFAPTMPQAALDATNVDHILPIDAIPQLLRTLASSTGPAADDTRGSDVHVEHRI